MKKKIFFIAIMMAFVSVCLYGQNARKFYKAGTEFIDNMKYDDAIVQFTSAIGIEPSNADYYLARGKAYAMLSKSDEAKADYEKAIVFDPKNVDAYINLGELCNKTEKFDEALIHLNHATRLDKRNKEVYPVKVLTLMGLEMYDLALRASDTAILIKDTPMDYYYRGIIYRRLNNDILGKRELEKAISKDKKLAEPRLELARLLIPIDPTAAMNQCNEVISFDDRNTEAYLVRSEIHKKNLDYPSAINDISKNILIDPENPSFYLARGNCYQEFNQHTNAINDYTKYITITPDDPDAFFARARSYEEIMSYDKAIEDYNKITVLSEFDMRARKMLQDSESRLYELNRETDPPEITVISPLPIEETIAIPGDKPAILITGKIKDESKLKDFMINNGPASFTEVNGEYEFLSNIDVSQIDNITLTARDDYDNEKVLSF